MSLVQGEFEPGFEAVRALFERQFSEGQHIGGAVAVYHRGRSVVDLWGGVADPATGRPWETDTMAVSFSTTKGLTATCLHVLADRGLLRYEDPVAKYWPEFAANGKQGITIYHLLTHQAGIPQLPDGVTLEQLTDWDYMVRGMEGLTPVWEPGTDSGYHAVNFGWLVGEVVRRVSGRRIGEFLREEVAGPLGLEHLYIGVPDDAEPLVSTLVSLIPTGAGSDEQRRQFLSPDSLTARALGTHLGSMHELLNSSAGRRAEIPAANGAMTARDLARLYACLGAGGALDGVRIMGEETARRMSERQTHRPDRVIVIPVGWALGYMTGGDAGWPQGPRVTSFGHAGFGGSIGYCDPEIELSFGLVVNALTIDLIGYGRTAALADTARACAEAIRSA